MGDLKDQRAKGHVFMPPDDSSPTSTRRGSGQQRSFWRELPVLVIVALVLAALLRAFVIQTFWIPSSSMEKTLHGCTGCTNDRVLVNRVVYRLHQPRPGDIVVFTAPAGWDVDGDASASGNFLTRLLNRPFGISNRPTLVKRVIAVGGQTVSCCDRRGDVVVDGHALHEPYVYTSGVDPKKRFGPVKVPRGDLWVMGDHRNVSADSRWHADAPSHGMVPERDVVGKVFAIMWPVNRWRLF